MDASLPPYSSVQATNGVQSSSPVRPNVPAITQGHPLDSQPASQSPATMASSGTAHGHSGGTSTPSQAHGENMAAKLRK